MVVFYNGFVADDYGARLFVSWRIKRCCRAVREGYGANYWEVAAQPCFSLQNLDLGYPYTLRTQSPQAPF